MSEKFRPVAADYWASPQIDESDVAAAARAGVALIINNRPDGEEPGQPAGAAIAAAAKAQGIAYVAIPVAGAPSISDADLDRFDAALAGAKGRVLAYCKSGTRSTVLRALARARSGAEPRALIEEAAEAGYAIEALAPHLAALAARR
jgi:uncharacterized protein (TIGR01244 family)